MRAASLERPQHPVHACPGRRTPGLPPEDLDEVAGLVEAQLAQRALVRFIGEWVHTDRDLTLCRQPEIFAAENGGFSGSAVFAYKLNWQTVLFAAYADNRRLDAQSDPQPADRQLFFKVSYAFQR